ncbi:D-alanyl-D-alanine carboxypeptidase DacB [Gottschalkia acidurici 9a]|uniref:serine-type D-Ala-D-Ala carboxypeptidase n=1 Tax=Gottschalkia acidurici (strain ATCC 7906 / DSM 604 / BCRC 14475 / CIP 104303 / KCTC 5404 / NCIMB 10678 / 9a) TaxID=1128398 RepID=K0AYV2_GOTA9|nr:D-alanyl-D-alanine carboxypeptidase family protein [Gottschalkia acidurici]AFS78424.1 D-alanyl-D-alanine carboxypeptidase DacB [Gottschalkia acidurici 9a]
MKFKRLITIIIAIILFQSGIVTVYGTEDNSIKLSAKSAVLIDSATGRILYSNNGDKRLPMASTTKIMTALVAIEKGDLDKKVTIKKESVGIEGSSIYLAENEEISLRDLLYGLMLRSGNDAATAIANEIGGSTEEFSKMMNEKAKQIGAKNSNFMNPHGLHDENHYTTAYDLAIITKEALKSKEFREISKARTWIAEREINKHFYNKNNTLWEYEGGDGGKTGFTKAAGRCLVTTATRNGTQLIAVVLNDGNWFNDCYTLMDYGFKNYKSFVIYSENQFIRNIDVINGVKENISVITKDELIIPLKEEEKDKIKTVVKLPKELSAPINKGDKIGELQTFLEGELISTTDLVSNDKVSEKSKYNKIKDMLKKII